jgi:hypothetical protein
MTKGIVGIHGIVRRRDDQGLDMADFVINDSMFLGDGTTK